MKVYYSDYPARRAQEEARKISWTDRRMEHERGYFLLRNGHVDCRKDNEEILRNTVMRKMQEDFIKLLNSRMIAVKSKSQFEVLLISKYSRNVKIMSENSKSCVTYKIVDGKHELATVMIKKQAYLLVQRSVWTSHILLFISRVISPTMPIFLVSPIALQIGATCVI